MHFYSVTTSGFILPRNSTGLKVVIPEIIHGLALLAQQGPSTSGPGLSLLLRIKVAGQICIRTVNHLHTRTRKYFISCSDSWCRDSLCTASPTAPRLPHCIAVAFAWLHLPKVERSLPIRKPDSPFCFLACGWNLRRLHGDSMALYGQAVDIQAAALNLVRFIYSDPSRGSCNLIDCTMATTYNWLQDWGARKQGLKKHQSNFCKKLR